MDQQTRDAIVKLFKFESLDINKNIFTFDKKYRFRLFEIDRYNNMYGEFLTKVDIEYLPKIAEYFEIVHRDKDTYNDGRIYTGIFIDYFQNYGDKLELEEIVFMAKNGNIKGSSFKEWLIGTSYSSHGNVPYNYKFTKEQIIKEIENGKI